MKKKITIIHPSIMPYRIDLFNKISQSFDLDFFLLRKSSLNQKMDESLIRSQLKFKTKLINVSLRFGVRILNFGIIKSLRDSDADIVIVGEYSLNTYIAYITKIVFSHKYKIYTICDDNIDIVTNSSVLNKIKRNYLESKLDGIILTNRNILEYYQKNFKQKKLVCFPIIQDEVFFRKELENSLSKSKKIIKDFNLNGKKIFMNVGRITGVKNLKFLINCFNKFNGSKSDNMLIIVGDGDQKEFLEKYVLQLESRKNILFVGRYDGIELKAWYNIGQVFILPSYYEPFGAVVNEALLSGQYVLCSKVAGSSFLINEFNGALFSSSNKMQLIDLLTIYSKKIYPLKETFLRDSKMKMDFESNWTKLFSFLND
jgi:glycosyltransferase involved in cell wall biosynthesis